jgi:ENTS family enterobactin (siderophore) exporter
VTAGPGVRRGVSAPTTNDMTWPTLRENRDFIAVLLGHGVSAIGDAVSFTAIPLLVLLLTGSGLAMGVVGVLHTAPDLIVGMIAGVYADRWDRRRIMLLADLGRAILTALVPLSYLLGGPTIVVLLLVVGPINILRVFFLAAYTAAVPNLVGRKQIGAATSAFEAVYALGFIIGPAVAGVLTVLIGPALTLGLDAASFAASTVALFAVSRPLSSSSHLDDRRLLAEVRTGIAFIRHHPILRLAVGLWSLYTILLAAWPAVILFYLTVDLHLDAGAFGLVVTAYGAGALAGSAVAARTVRQALGAPILLGAASVGALTILTASQDSVPILMVLTFLAGIGDLLIIVGYGTLRATVTPDNLLGRVSSTSRTLSVGGQSLGFLVAGLLLDRIGGAATLTLIGIALVSVAGTFALAAPLRGATADNTAVAS